jgi:phospholipid/cholesterol/gamma-HCH transport system ATP-binding protein
MDIRVTNLVKRFKNNHVLRGLHLEIKQGKITVIIGGSGTGKSVLLKLLLGLLSPDEGAILVNGQDITKLSESALYPIRRQFGMIFQTGGLLNSLTVGENVALGLREHRLVPHEQIAQVVHEKLALVDLADKENEMPAILSGGMRKRVSIARALTLNPRVILYDEPTAGLDPPMAENIDSLILNLNQQFGVTSVVVTHDMISAFKLAHTVNMLHEGRIIASGSPADFQKSHEPIIHDFIKRK